VTTNFLKIPLFEYFDMHMYPMQSRIQKCLFTDVRKQFQEKKCKRKNILHEAFLLGKNGFGVFAGDHLDHASIVNVHHSTFAAQPIVNPPRTPARILALLSEPKSSRFVYPKSIKTTNHTCAPSKQLSHNTPQKKFLVRQGVLSCRTREACLRTT
jgi:hypothetical protein